MLILSSALAYSPQINKIRQYTDKLHKLAACRVKCFCVRNNREKPTLQPDDFSIISISLAISVHKRNSSSILALKWKPWISPCVYPKPPLLHVPAIRLLHHWMSDSTCVQPQTVVPCTHISTQPQPVRSAGLSLYMVIQVTSTHKTYIIAQAVGLMCGGLWLELLSLLIKVLIIFSSNWLLMEGSLTFTVTWYRHKSRVLKQH